MREQDFDDRSRRAARVFSRRATLMTLGGAAVTAAVAGPSRATAKTKGKNAAKKCKGQVDDCRLVVSAFCVGRPGCEDDLRPCCSFLSGCDADRSLDCMFATLRIVAE